MKIAGVTMLVLMLLNLWVPFAQAEISKDLDPMVSSDVLVTVTEAPSVSGSTTTGQASNGVSAADTAVAEKKTDETKKEKSKKSSKKKSSVKKKTKSSSKISTKHKKSTSN